jgi:hypothetical protein
MTKRACIAVIGGSLGAPWAWLVMASIPWMCAMAGAIAQQWAWALPSKTP